MLTAVLKCRQLESKALGFDDEEESACNNKYLLCRSINFTQLLPTMSLQSQESG